MKTHNTFFKKIIKLGFLLMIGFSMTACTKTLSWKEEVQLHNGSIIIIKRFFNLGGYPAIESRERAPLDETVTFIHPQTGKKIVWKTDFRDSVPEASDLNLILLDIVKGVPYIATYPTACIAYNKWKRPNPPQILFKYEGEQWKRIDVSEFPIELGNANVIVGRPATSLLKPYYKVAQINAINYDIHEVAYKTVLREPVKGYGQNCPILVRIEGGWSELGGAKAPIPVAPDNTIDIKK